MSQIIIATNNPALNHKTGNQYPQELTAFSMRQKATSIHSVQQIFNTGLILSWEKDPHVLHFSEVNRNSKWKVTGWNLPEQICYFSIWITEFHLTSYSHVRFTHSSWSSEKRKNASSENYQRSYSLAIGIEGEQTTPCPVRQQESNLAYWLLYL